MRYYPPQLPPNTTGVRGSFDLAPTIDLVLRLQPDTREVFYIGGSTPAELILRDEAKREFKPYNGRLAFTYLNDLPFPTLLDRIGELPTHSDLKNRTDLDGSIHNLKTLVSDVHGLSHRLHSSQLEHLGLKAALTQVCAQISHTFGLGIDLQIDATPDRSARDLSLCFYRVAQEALNNIVKHSRSNTALLALSEKSGLLRMEIRDSGVGFKPGMPGEWDSVYQPCESE